MRHTTLYMKVGRAAPKPLHTVDDSASNADTVLNAQEQRAMVDCINAGVDPARVEFTRETVDVPEAATPQASVARSAGRKR